MKLFRKLAAILAAAGVIVAAPGPACHQAAAQTIVRTGGVTLSAAGIVLALGVALKAPTLTPLSAPALA
ncbi:MAG: hypothetical protein ABL955_04645, partial [Elusimicrobiota bacterium]